MLVSFIMGYLLKEALKTLCGVNQWSYAIFWKIGCQNPNLTGKSAFLCRRLLRVLREVPIRDMSIPPYRQISNRTSRNRTFQYCTRLLIWEECFYENSGTSISKPDFEAWSSAEPNNGQLGNQALNRVHFLVTKMMMDNQVNVVGEGLVGRAAFTGIYQWILSHNFNQEAHPTEVLNEVFQQFSAGMQTIAVIPVLPHGVVQFGSTMPMMENANFVDNVKTLILQLGCVPGILLSENYASHETNIFHSRTDIFPTSSASSSFLMPQPTRYDTQIAHAENPYQLANCAAKDEVMIPANSEVWLNQPTCSYLPRPNFDSGVQEHASRSKCNNVGLVSSSCQGFDTHEPFGMEMNSSESFMSSGLFDNSTMNKMLNSGYSCADNSVHRDLDDDLYKSIPRSSRVWTENFSDLLSDPILNDERQEYGSQSVTTSDMIYEEGIDASGNDLFDILGVDFKNKLLNQSWNNYQDSGSESSITNLKKKNSAIVNSFVASAADLLAVNQGQTGNFTLPSRNKDHLLDAMISNNQSSSKQILDNSNSTLWKTKTAHTSSFSGPNVTSSGGEVDISGQVRAELSGKQDLFDSCSYKPELCEVDVSGRVRAELSGKQDLFDSCSYKPELSEVDVSGQVRAELSGKQDLFDSCSYKHELSKDGLRSYSYGSSLYGSQSSSWIDDQGHENKPSSSVSTSYSKKTEDSGKTIRKRLKPGENPRPRPKDRQMIQDRVKELRDIVPNGAKCSIDALLERTIKHMIFLQSVTKHADKLKQSGESKIFSEEGGLRIKDNNDGGATWAYEVGSQSLVCPIVVEDLNQPRQMLVEMLCEESGLFLEIADIVRGLGLTILKGVMEAKKDKIWARFAVEANRDVTRMEIFVSLVRLLDQNTKNNVVSAANECH